MKIRIVGGPGSGKSTLALKLSNLLGLSHLDLDDVKWRSKEDFSDFRSPEEKAKYFKDWYGKHSSWIIEGSSANSWNWISMQESTLVIVLKHSLIKEFFRIFLRSFRKMTYSGRKETFWRSAEMYMWAWEFRFKRLPKVLKRLDDEDISYVVCRNRNDVNDVISSFFD